MRLIDADKLIRRMRIDMDRMKYQYNLDVIEGMSLAIGYIVGRPTAYDPEKVIEKLQVLSDKADDDIAVCEADTCQYYDGYGDGLDRAIEIVKRGGRDEKYASEIIEIACKYGAVNERTGELKGCSEIICEYCLFRYRSKGSCKEEMKAWLESEYVEKPVISKRDRAILKYLNANINYIARDMDGSLYVYISKPFKVFDHWKVVEFEKSKSLRMVDIDFPMVKWSDSEPWLIEYLKKLEVVDNYE